MISVLLPIRTCSEANWRGHWAQRARRVRSQRGTARHLVQVVLPYPRPTPLVIRLTRLAPGRLDSDNLVGALKAVRDGVAGAIEIDDGDPGIDWQYQQKPSPHYAVLVDIHVLGD